MRPEGARLATPATARPVGYDKQRDRPGGGKLQPDPEQPVGRLKVPIVTRFRHRIVDHRFQIISPLRQVHRRPQSASGCDAAAIWACRHTHWLLRSSSRFGSCAGQSTSKMPGTGSRRVRRCAARGAPRRPCNNRGMELHGPVRPEPARNRPGFPRVSCLIKGWKAHPVRPQPGSSWRARSCPK